MASGRRKASNAHKPGCAGLLGGGSRGQAKNHLARFEASSKAVCSFGSRIKGRLALSSLACMSAPRAQPIKTRTALVLRRRLFVCSLSRREGNKLDVFSLILRLAATAAALISRGAHRTCRTKTATMDSRKRQMVCASRRDRSRTAPDDDDGGGVIIRRDARGANENRLNGSSRTAAAAEVL